MNIRPSRYRDFPGIKEIFAVAFTEEYQRREVDIVRRIEKIRAAYPVVKLLSCFPNPYQHLFTVHVAEETGRIAGLVQMSPRNHYGTRWHIDNIAVHPDFRGQGVAQALLQSVFEYYSQRGGLRYTLEVDASNQAAIKLYEKTGFRRYSTLYYYKLAPKSLAKFRDKDSLTLPPHVRPRVAADKDALWALYEETIPSYIRLVEERSPSDFAMTPVQLALEQVKKSTKRSEALHFVVEDPHRRCLVASIDLYAQHRALPHVVQFILHPAYGDMAEQLLTYALHQAAQISINPVLIGSFESQRAKRDAIQALGFKKVTSDFLMVRDNAESILLPQTAAAEKAKDGFFNPVTLNKHPGG
jgi:ribosomal protein S18 acetylase RimI-like enzyme